MCPSDYLPLPINVFIAFLKNVCSYRISLKHDRSPEWPGGFCREQSGLCPLRSRDDKRIKPLKPKTQILGNPDHAPSCPSVLCQGACLSEVCVSGWQGEIALFSFSIKWWFPKPVQCKCWEERWKCRVLVMRLRSAPSQLLPSFFMACLRTETSDSRLELVLAR